MGDRSNIIMAYDGGGEVAFYTHWRGSDVPTIVREALIAADKAGRIEGDPDYLARIVFCTLVRGYEDEATGFGIGPAPLDWEHPAVVIHTDTCEVSLRDLDSAEPKKMLGKRRIPFAEFMAMEVPDSVEPYEALVMLAHTDAPAATAEGADHG